MFTNLLNFSLQYTKRCSIIVNVNGNSKTHHLAANPAKWRCGYSIL
nr:MAG TPA: hypothetical protein [Caudoviricetes sp.]